MPFLDTDSLIEQYYKEVKDKYPQFNLEQFAKICKCPFYYIRSHMARLDMPLIHIKYFGKFVVLSSNVKRIINENNIKLKVGVIGKEQHKETHNKLVEIYDRVLEDEKANKGRSINVKDIEIVEK